MAQPEKIESTVAQMPVAPIVVTPIPAEQSRTLRNIKWCAIWTAFLAALPTIVAFVVELMGNPETAALISNYVPAPVRVFIMFAIGFYLRGSWKTRMDTAQPIIGSTGEAKAKAAE